MLTSQEHQMSMPFIAASWYDHLVAANPTLQEIMTREEYISAFVKVHGQQIIIAEKLMVGL